MFRSSCKRSQASLISDAVRDPRRPPGRVSVTTRPLAEEAAVTESACRAVLAFSSDADWLVGRLGFLRLLQLHVFAVALQSDLAWLGH